jgi:hypothetical protein
MLSQVEAHRLAAALNQLRPDWPLASLSTWIRNNLTDRAYRDAAVALTWVACESETTSPARVLEAGPWWRATQAGAGTVSAISTRCPEHPAHTAWNCPDCDAGAVAPERAAELAQQTRAAIPRRQVTHRHPTPEPPNDLASARARADAQEA